MTTFTDEPLAAWCAQTPATYSHLLERARLVVEYRESDGGTLQNCPVEFQTCADQEEPD